VVVLGVPRGGVPVAAEVAALGAPLDVFVVRELGVPGHEEFAMGAIASGGVRVLSQDALRVLKLSREVVDAIAATEQRELDRREREYRRGRPFPDLHGATVILVDDGVATERASHLLSQAADRCEAEAVPEGFRAMAEWYQDSSPTTDEEVRGVLCGPSKVPAPPKDPELAPSRERRYAGWH
jgi:putative phosphoribosyl transferase